MTTQILIQPEHLENFVKKIVNEVLKNKETQDTNERNITIKSDHYQPHNKVAKILRDKRYENRLSITEVSRKIGVSQSYISRLEAGQRRLNMDLIELFAKVYNCNPKDLMPDAN